MSRSKSDSRLLGGTPNARQKAAHYNTTEFFSFVSQKLIQTSIAASNFALRKLFNN